MRNVGLKGRTKIADKWGRDVYIVEDQLNPDILVYQILPEASGKKMQLLQRNLLMPRNFPPNQNKFPIPVGRNKNQVAQVRRRSIYKTWIAVGIATYLTKIPISLLLLNQMPCNFLP